MQSCKLFGTSRLAGGFLFIQKKKAPEKGLSGALSLLQNFFFKRSNQCASY